MIPILYSADTTLFVTNGLGSLSDAITCTVTEERNGIYELTMTYPVNGSHYADISERSIIYAIPSPYRNPQPFRIYQIEAPLNGIVTIHAHHISYDLSGLAVSPCSITGTAEQAMNLMLSNAQGASSFVFDSDVTGNKDFAVKVPSSFRAMLGGTEGSVLDLYHGEFLFDEFDVHLLTNRGTDSGVRIAYGKNLTSFKMTEDLGGIVTGVYPYWADSDGNIVEITGKVLTLVTTDYDNILPVDLSSEFDEQPTPAQLLTATQAYVASHDLTVPKVTFDVSFIDLASTDEYAGIAQLEQVDLCDTVTVVFPMYGLNATAKVVKIETNVLADRYNLVTIGTIRTTLADTIAKLSSGSSATVSGGSSADPHPVGSVVITDTNTNPSASFGGTWSLIDKQFTPTEATNINSAFTIYSTNTTSADIYCVREGHTITISCASLVNKVALSNTNLRLGDFNLSALGATELAFTPQFVGLCDGANALILMDLNRTSGRLESQNVVIRGTGTSVSANNTTMFTVVITCDYTKMVDSFCNQFYWRRTA